MEDFTAFDSAAARPGPQTNYGSHEEFLKAAVLRHKISTAIHGLSIEELAMVLEYVANVSIHKAVSGAFE